MILTTIEQFAALPIGAKLHQSIDTHHNPYFYAGLNPKATGWIMLIDGGSHVKVECIGVKYLDSERNVITDDYEECKQIMLAQSFARTATIKEIYLNK